MKTIAILTLFAAAATTQAAIIPLNFEGNAGEGLLPGNEVGTGAETSASTAIGGEVGSNGLLLDTDLDTLEFSFEFSNLTGGLTNAAGGIHFHRVDPGEESDPFNNNGGIVFNLNIGDNGQVDIDTGILATDGSVTSATVTGTLINLTPAQEADFVSGNYYLNIHSNGFGGGELRGNVVPEPAAAGGLFGLFGLLLARRRA